MSTESRDDLLQRFIAGPERIRQALGDAVGEAILEPGLEGWSVRDVLVHLSDAEVLRAIRFRLILAEDPNPLPFFDQEVWRERLGYEGRDPRLAIAIYEATIVSSHELVAALGGSALDRTGLHPEEGPITVRELVTRGANHADEHAAQIRALLA
ncbi:MAG: DinB family protein [Dehalococcoidia bacterium]